MNKNENSNFERQENAQESFFVWYGWSAATGKKRISFTKIKDDKIYKKNEYEIDIQFVYGLDGFIS